MPQHLAHEDPDDDEFPPQDAVEEEDTGGGESDVKPWDPSKIRITTKNFSLRDVVDQIADKEIDLSPDFQRDYVWKPRQRTRLIESILLGIPLPASTSIRPEMALTKLWTACSACPPSRYL